MLSTTPYLWRLTQKVVWGGNWKFASNGFDFDEFYNPADDPYERTNLADDPAHWDQVLHMTQLFWQYAKDSGDTFLTEIFHPALRLGIVEPL